MQYPLKYILENVHSMGEKFRAESGTGFGGGRGTGGGGGSGGGDGTGGGDEHMGEGTHNRMTSDRRRRAAATDAAAADGRWQACMALQSGRMVLDGVVEWNEEEEEEEEVW